MDRGTGAEGGTQTRIEGMQVHQFSVIYVQEQDRILMRINTTTGEQLRVWLTRRLMLPLWPRLNQSVAEHVVQQKGVQGQVQSPLAHSDDLTKQMMADFEREGSIKTSDFKTPFNADSRLLPFGNDPLVVTKISLTPLENGSLRLEFEERLPQQTGVRAFKVALTAQTMHAVIHLLEKALNRSGWVGDGNGESAVPTTLANAEKPRYLN